jgi:hypothetical protein
MSEKLEERRSFEFTHDDGKEVTYFLGMPTSEQIRKADWHYSKMYNKALIEGVATESEMADILKKRGIIGEEYDKKKVELQVALVEKLTLMDVAEGTLEKGQLALEARVAREALFQWNQRATGPMSNSCEQMATDAKTEYLTSAILQTEDGTLVWSEYDSFVAEASQRLAIKSRYEVMLWLEGLEQNFLENSPEDVVMRELAVEEAKTEAKLLAEPVEEAPKKPKAKAPKKPRKKAVKAG